MKIFIILFIVFLTFVFSEGRSTEERDVEPAVQLGIQRVVRSSDEADIDGADDHDYDTNVTNEPSLIEQDFSSSSNTAATKPSVILKKITSKTEKLLNKLFPSKTPTKRNTKVRKDAVSSFLNGLVSANGEQQVTHRPPITAEDKLSLLQIKLAADKIENEIDNIDLENRASAQIGLPSELKGFLPTKPPDSIVVPVIPDYSGQYQGFNPNNAGYQGTNNAGTGNNGPVKQGEAVKTQTVGTDRKMAPADIKKGQQPEATSVYIKEEQEMAKQILGNEKQLGSTKTKEKGNRTTNKNAKTPKKTLVHIRSAAPVEQKETIEEKANETNSIDKPKVLTEVKTAGDTEPSKLLHSVMIEPETDESQSVKNSKCDQLNDHIELIKIAIYSLNSKLEIMSKNVLEANTNNLNIETAAIQANRDIVIKSEKKTNDTNVKFQKNIIKLLNEQKMMQKKLVQEISNVMKMFIQITMGVDLDSTHPVNKQHKAMPKNGSRKRNISRRMTPMDKYPNLLQTRQKHHYQETVTENSESELKKQEHKATVGKVNDKTQKHGPKYSQLKSKTNKTSAHNNDNNANSKPIPKGYKTYSHPHQPSGKPQQQLSSEHLPPIPKVHKPHTSNLQQTVGGTKSAKTKVKHIKPAVTAKSGGKHHKTTAEKLAQSPTHYAQSIGQQQLTVQIQTGEITFANPTTENKKLNNADNADNAVGDDDELTDEELDKLLDQLTSEDND